jgi:hypothetical protein
MNKFLKIIVFSLLEALTIGLLWDFFFDKGQIVLASLLTFLLLAVEHVFARNTADGKNLFSNLKHRFGLQAVLGATEIVFWDIWRLIHKGLSKLPGVGPVLALVVFSLLMIPQHNLEQNVNSDQPFWKRIFRSQGVAISVIEAVTALAWILTDDIGTGHQLLALVPLGLGLAVEHAVREFGEPRGANF